MGSWRALVVRFAQEFKWDLDKILGLTMPQARILLQGLSESIKVRAIMTKAAQAEALSDSPGGGNGTGRKGNGVGAYTDRYVKGRGNVLVCPRKSVREEATSRDKAGRVLTAKIHLDDPRALFSLPGTEGSAPGFAIVDKRKKRKKKPPKEQG